MDWSRRRFDVRRAPVPAQAVGTATGADVPRDTDVPAHADAAVGSTALRETPVPLTAPIKEDPAS